MAHKAIKKLHKKYEILYKIDIILAYYSISIDNLFYLHVIDKASITYKRTKII